MIIWHRSSCRKADICLAGQVPYCGRCDSIAPSEFDTSPLSGPPALPYSCQGNLNLSWPSSVSYSTEPISQDGESTTYLTPQIPIPVSSPGTEQRQLYEPQPDPSRQHDSAPGYETLDSNNKIRLLHLKKGTRDDPLHGNLISTSLKGPVTYEAVSYVWADENGDTTRSSPLYLGERWTILPITRNCEAALRRLRSHKTDRFLWIDAVCINQANVRERSHQVGLMSQIYSTARTCLVYIGEHRDNSEMAMRLMDRDRFPDELSKDISTALSNLFRRPYFSRTWILQELVLSSKIVVYCGDDTANWHKVISKPWENYPTIYIPSWVKNFAICCYKQALDFPRWVFEMGSTDASDPRDKIFAILGLFRGLEDDGLNPDYSLSTAQVYTGVATYLLLKYDMKHIIGTNETPSADLPSWVPDWRHIEPDQWNGGNQAFEHKDLRRHIMPLRTTLSDYMSELPNLPDLFSMYWKNQSCNGIPSIEIVGRDGGLLIRPHYLISLESFTAFPNLLLFEWPWAWEMLSTGLDSTHGYYVTSFEGNRCLLLLKEVFNKLVYRIVRRCDLAIPLRENHQLRDVKAILREDHQLRDVKAILELVKRHIVIGKDFDPVRYWVSRGWSRILWIAYIHAIADYNSLSPAGISQEDDMRSLQVAFKEYLSLRRRNANPGELYRLFASGSNDMPVSCQRAKQLIGCIKFWSNSDVWNTIMNNPLHLMESQLLQTCQQTLLSVKNILLSEPTILVDDEMTNFADKLRMIIPLMRNFDKSLPWSRVTVISTFPQYLSMVRINSMISSIQLIKNIVFRIEHMEQKPTSWNEDNSVSVAEEPNDEGNIHRHSWDIITGLIRAFAEEIIDAEQFAWCCGLENIGPIHSWFQSICRNKKELWDHLLKTVEELTNSDQYSLGSIQRILMHIMDGLGMEEFETSYKFAGLDIVAARKCFDTSSITSAILNLFDRFGDIYLEIRKQFEEHLKAEFLYSRRDNPKNSNLDVGTAVNAIIQVPPDLIQEPEIAECRFAQSVIDIWTVLEQGKRIMII
ncbi:HET-domain-containing protein [Hypoxylon sp. FL1857]|nr:HET-domain-containing protein [Hypoxylon sp. FL1857]